MKDSTQELLARLESEHDWAEGPMTSGGGTKFMQTDTCRVCSLRRHYVNDPQNGIEHQYRFSDGETKQDLSLRQAITRGCAHGVEV